jgi:hypothetical protein
MTGTSWDKMTAGEKACLCENVAMTPFYWGRLCAAGALTDREKVLVLRKQTLTPEVFNQLYASLGNGPYRLLADISEAKARKTAQEEREATVTAALMTAERKIDALTKRVESIAGTVANLTDLLDIEQHCRVHNDQRIKKLMEAVSHGSPEGDPAWRAFIEENIETLKKRLSILTDAHMALRSSLMNHLFSSIEDSLKTALARLLPNEPSNPYGAGVLDNLFGRTSAPVATTTPEPTEEAEAHGRMVEVEMKPVATEATKRRVKGDGEPPVRTKTGVTREKDPRSQGRAGTHRRFKVVKDGKQQCSRCKKWKTTDLFHRDKSSGTGFTSYCADCARKNTRDHAAALKNASL